MSPEVPFDVLQPMCVYMWRPEGDSNISIISIVVVVIVVIIVIVIIIIWKQGLSLSLEFTNPALLTGPPDLGSSSLDLWNLSIIGMLHHAQFMQCWGQNPGMLVC